MYDGTHFRFCILVRGDHNVIDAVDHQLSVVQQRERGQSYSYKMLSLRSKVITSTNTKSIHKIIYDKRQYNNKKYT